MPFRNKTIPAIALFSLAVFIWTFAYGPARREFISQDKTVTVHSARDIEELWRSSGVHGRVAVVFARHLSRPFPANTFPEMDYLDAAMNHGIVREAYYIVPDRMWTQVIAESIENPSIIVQPKLTDTGYILLHEDGRIYVIPLSKYIPDLGQEKALVVIEPAIWSSEEQSRIDGFVKSGQLTSDLTVIVGDVK